MKQTAARYLNGYIAAGILIMACLVLMPASKAAAADTPEATAVSVGAIDYDALTMYVNTNGNTIVYYSTDKKTWYEVEGMKNAGNTSYIMDISWITSTKENTLYFKGDEAKTIVSVTVPAKNNDFKVVYSKVDGDFEFEGCDEAVFFEWRKAVDLSWHMVPLTTNSAAYKNFLQQVDNLLVKGGKLVFRIPQVRGVDGDDIGARPSKEITITLSKRSSAPGVKVNQDKLTINTSASMEFFNERTNRWVDCDRNMPLSDIAPGTLFKNGARGTTLKIRTAATSSRTYSKTAYLTIPGQEGPLIIGDSRNDVAYWYQNGKVVLQFGNASSTKPFSFAVIKNGNDFDPAAASWRSVKSTRPITLSRTTAPDNCTIYVRKSGIAYSATKGIDLQLATEANSFKVSYD